MRRMNLGWKPWSALLIAAGLGLAQLPALVQGTPTAPTKTMPLPTKWVPGLEEPLVASGATSATENSALADAVKDFGSMSADNVDFAQRAILFERFLESYPATQWRLSIQTNLGIGYYHEGHFSKASINWRAAWEAGKSATDQNSKALADRAVGELARMHARVGDADALDELFAEIGAREVSGSATEMLAGAREGLWMFRNDPGVSYLCGPMALKNLLQALRADPAKVQALYSERSGPTGYNFAQVSALANRAGLAHRVVVRTSDQPIPVPSVVNWKINHFAAIVEEKEGRYRIQDPTFGSGDLWVTKQAIDAEGSGYFLVPKKFTKSVWREANSKEAASIYGMGFTTSSSPGSGTSDDEPLTPPDCGKGMCVVNAKVMLVSLNLNDTPIGYEPARGPAVKVRFSYNQREAGQPAVFSFSNVSPKWSMNFMSWIQDNPTAPGASVSRFPGGGGYIAYTSPYTYSNATGQFSPERQGQAVLVRIPATGALTSYELRMSDGSKHVYAKVDGASTSPRRVFLTSVVDAAGNALSLNYDGSARLTSIGDAIGRQTSFAYESASAPLLLTKVTDPSGRVARLSYDAAGRLASIVDVQGIQSSFQYDGAGLVNAMTTPYGTSRFAFGGTGTSRFLEITDPQGATERIEYRHEAPGIAFRDSTNPDRGWENQYVNYRNTFHWDKSNYATTGIDYTKARIWHWLHTQDLQTGPILESTKNPLENRVWFKYPDQTRTLLEGSAGTPTTVARELDGGAVQASNFTYNINGLPLTAIDAVGRKTVYTYATNGIDLLKVQQQVAADGSLATVSEFTYNSQHRPLTSTNAAGKTTSYTYNPSGQLASSTDALNKTTRYNYDDQGRLTSIVNANGAAQESRTYDAVDRIATTTNSEGYKLVFSFDALDRLTKVTFPNGTSTDNTYTNLDLTSVKDRLGRVTTYAYDANRRLLSTTDPLARKTSYSYYANGTLRSLTDPNGNTTSWDVDLQSRPTAKRFADGKTETYTYGSATSRLKSAQDALGQVKTFGYFNDDLVKTIAYSNAANPTASVSFQYDAFFKRPTAMTDGVGTTNWAYHPMGALGANLVKSVTSPVAGATVRDQVDYTYDALNREVSRSVNGSNQGASFDALGRVTSETNALDAFTFAYVGDTQRVSAISSAKGPRVAMEYFGATGDELLKKLTYATSAGAVLSQYGYTYDANHNVSSFTETFLNPKTAALAAPFKNGAGPVDAAPSPMADRALANVRGGQQDYVALMLAMVALGALAAWRLRPWQGGQRLRWIALPVAGSLALTSCSGGSGGGGGSSDPTPPAATSTTKVSSYAYDTADRLLSGAVGTDTTPATGSPLHAYSYDAASNLTSLTVNGSAKTLAYTTTNAISSGTYDANGSPTSLGGWTYRWDAANRLVNASNGTNSSSFTYDGASRLVRIVDQQAATVVGDKSYLWCGLTRCQERDNAKTGLPVSRLYFAQGVVTGGVASHYALDQLGSVRQLLDTAGIVQAQYAFDPYGNRTKLSGSIDIDAGYAGQFQHSATGLSLATFRAYNSQAGRWLNRDPIAENGGVNLYAHVKGNPIAFSDSLGLARAPSGGGSPGHRPNTPDVPSAPPGSPLPPAPPGPEKCDAPQSPPGVPPLPSGPLPPPPPEPPLPPFPLPGMPPVPALPEPLSKKDVNDAATWVERKALEQLLGAYNPYTRPLIPAYKLYERMIETRDRLQREGREYQPVFYPK